MPTVSIITPCYNSARFVARTIASVRAQTFADWEHIVVDDGSADESAAEVEALLAEEPRLRLIRQPNGGVCRARNRGYQASSPDSAYLLFLDADDCLEPRMLEVMVGILEAHPEVGFVHCGHRFIDADDNLLPLADSAVGFRPRYAPGKLGVRALPPDWAETPFVSIFALAGIVPSLVVMRRSVYAQTPGWDETFGQHYEDTDLFLHLALRARVRYVPEPLVRHRRHAGQSTADTGKFARQEQKLYAKWRRMEGLTAPQRAVVEAAWRFYEGRLTPYIGLRAGNRHLRRGEAGCAARFYLGALRRYAASFVPGFPLPGRSSERSP